MAIPPFYRYRTIFHNPTYVNSLYLNYIYWIFMDLRSTKPPSPEPFWTGSTNFHLGKITKKQVGKAIRSRSQGFLWPKQGETCSPRWTSAIETYRSQLSHSALQLTWNLTHVSTSMWLTSKNSQPRLDHQWPPEPRWFGPVCRLAGGCTRQCRG